MDDELDLDYGEEYMKNDDINVYAQNPGQNTAINDGRDEQDEEWDEEMIKSRRPTSPDDIREETEKIYHELRVDNGYDKRSVVVKGVDNMNRYSVEKIFAAFHPYRTTMLDDSTCVVNFASRGEAAKMLIGMTKALRRVRARKSADEEGEVMDSDDEDEEGQIKTEGGDDVAVVDKANAEPRPVRHDIVEIDMDTVNIPNGRWRVVTEHVPEKRLMLVRYASTTESKLAQESFSVQMEESGRKRRAVEMEGFTYKWTNEDKVRPGLNVFDDKGEELDWDYEHDTRFFNDKNAEKEDEGASEKKEVSKAAPNAVKVRGRGAKKGGFLFGTGGSGTLASDDMSPEKRRKKTVSTGDDDREWVHEPLIRDVSHTSQPWDKIKKSSRMADRLSKK